MWGGSMCSQLGPIGCREGAYYSQLGSITDRMPPQRNTYLCYVERVYAHRTDQSDEGRGTVWVVSATHLYVGQQHGASGVLAGDRLASLAARLARCGAARWQRSQHQRQVVRQVARTRLHPPHEGRVPPSPPSRRRLPPPLKLLVRRPGLVNLTLWN
eukprot:692316-Prorocentrum_minimum.AAC.1